MTHLRAEQDISNERASKMDDITDHDMLIRIDANIGYMKEDIVEIKEQVKETNGRVGCLEKWKAWINGGLKIFGVVLGLGGVIIAIIKLAHGV